MKKIYSLVIIMNIIISMIIVPANAMTSSELSGKLQSLKSQYPNGTHQTKFYNSVYPNDGTACYKDLSGHSSWECMAWARKVYDSLWGKSVSNGQFHQNASNLYVGDYVRYNAGSYDHSILITNIVNSTVYYTDCNLKFDGKIQWDRQTTISDLQTKINKQLNKSTSGRSYGHIVHYPGNNIKDLQTPHTHSYTTYVWKWADHPHYKCYQCYCGEVKENTNEPTYVESCSTCMKHEHQYTTYVWKWADHPHYNCYRCYCGEVKENTNEPMFAETCSRCLDTISLNDFHAKIVNVKSGKCVTNEDGNAIIKADVNDSDQWWRFIKQDDGSYKIKSLLDNGCLNIASSGTTSGTNIEVSIYDNGSDAQRWDIIKNIDSYMLKARCTECVADVEGGATEDGTNIRAYTMNRTEAQLYNITPYNPRVSFDITGGEINHNPKVVCFYDSINGRRGENCLVVFNQSEERTGTNIWGAEVLVDTNNRVIQIIDGVGNATVPKNGFVLSGHNAAQSWILKNISIGDYVLYNELDKTIVVYNENEYLFVNKTLKKGMPYGLLPIPIKNGYIFRGWFTEKDGGTKVTSDTIANDIYDIKLYAQWEESFPHTLSTVIKSGTACTVKTELFGFTDSCDVIIVGYKNNKYVTMQRTPLGEVISPCILEGDIDEIKVMVWDSLSSLCSYSDVEVIPESDFSLE